MESLASMGRCNGANVCSGPVLRQHHAHPRTLNHNPGVPALPFCPPATRAHLPRCRGRCAGRRRGARGRRSLQSNQRHACWKDVDDAPAGRRAWGAARDELTRHPSDGCGEMQPVQPCGVARKAPLQLREVSAAATRQGKVLSLGHGHETETTSSPFRKLSSILK